MVTNNKRVLSSEIINNKQKNEKENITRKSDGNYQNSIKNTGSQKSKNS